MGSDAKVFLFDYTRYRAHVVPAVHRWLLTSHLPADAILTSISFASPPPPGTDLAADSTTIGHDLRFLGPTNEEDAWFDDWDARRCQSRDCPSRSTCPWHQVDGNTAETANFVIQRLLAWFDCLGPSRFVGRTVNTGEYGQLLNELGAAPGSPVYALLGSLGSRGRVIGWTFGNSDGIHGWLDADETLQLAAQLDGLSLPHYEPTLEAIDAQAYAGNGNLNTPWDLWSLSIVRTMSQIAAERCLGILWGNDLDYAVRKDFD